MGGQTDLTFLLNHIGAKFGEAYAIQHRFPTTAKGDSHGAALEESVLGSRWRTTKTTTSG